MKTTLNTPQTWSMVEERLAREDDPMLRRNLEAVLEHMKGEATLDYARIMATIAENPDWHNYFPGTASPQGWDEVDEYYKAYAESGIRLELTLHNLVVDDHCVVTEGKLRTALPARSLARRGIHTGDPDPDAYYLTEMRICTLWRIDEHGKVLGEDTYKSSAEDDIVPFHRVELD